MKGKGLYLHSPNDAEQESHKRAIGGKVKENIQNQQNR